MSAITSPQAGSPLCCLIAFLAPCLDTVLPILARVTSTPDPWSSGWRARRQRAGGGRLLALLPGWGC